VPDVFRYTEAQKQALAAAGGAAVHLLLYGGSRSGKSFALCCALVVRALKSPGSRHAVVRRYFSAVHASTAKARGCSASRTAPRSG